MRKTKAQPQEKTVQPGKKPPATWSADRAARLRQAVRARTGLDCNCDCGACACGK